MKDTNGIEIKTGDIVEITGAYFKNDNGIYFVDRTPGDAGWLGGYYSLKKISKNGTIKQTKYSTGSWPIVAYTNDRFKNAESKEWNAEHATITIRTDINKKYIAEHFKSEADNEKESMKYYIMRGFDETSDYINTLKATAKLHEEVANKLAA